MFRYGFGLPVQFFFRQAAVFDHGNFVSGRFKPSGKCLGRTARLHEEQSVGAGGSAGEVIRRSGSIRCLGAGGSAGEVSLRGRQDAQTFFSCDQGKVKSCCRSAEGSLL